jgi:DNA-binding NarL/FixJ family response regulator
MARVLALTADLLFGSRLQASLAAAGHEAWLVAGESELRAALAGAGAEALLVDLTDDELRGAAIVRALAPELAGVRTLAYYAHVEPAARDRALQAGIELAVPRSRIAREAPELLAGLLAAGPRD